MTDLFTHWIDVVHWAMKYDQPREAQVLADKYVFDEWECPDTIQAAFRYPGFDVVYEGMMNSSIDDGGLEFRGTEATLKITRRGFSVYREGGAKGREPGAHRTQLPRRHDYATWRISFSASRHAKSPTRLWRPALRPARAGHIGNLAYHRGGPDGLAPEDFRVICRIALPPSTGIVVPVAHTGT